MTLMLAAVSCTVVHRMIIYSLLVVMRTRNKTISLLKKQLVLVSYYIFTAIQQLCMHS